MREFTEAEEYIADIIARTPEPVPVPQVYVEEVLQFFELYGAHKGIVRAGEGNLGGPQLIGIVDPQPELLEHLRRNR